MRRGLALASVAIFLLSISVVRQAAAAAAGEFVYVKIKGTADPNDSGAALRFCPNGTRMVGAGGAITDPASGWLARVEPFDLSIFDPDDDEDDGAVVQTWNESSSPKGFTATAICMRGGGNQSLTYKRKIEAGAAGDGVVTSSVSCEADEHLIGGGAGIDPSSTDGLAASSAVNSTTWSYAERIAGSPGGGVFSGVVVCLPIGARQIVLRSSGSVDLGPGQTKTLAVRCGRRQHVSAGGAGAPQIISSRPIDGKDADHVTDDGWSGRLRNPNVFSIPVSVTAVCVR